MAVAEPASSVTLPDAAEPGPLAGVRVLDLCGYLAGPYGCTLLADQGADVIKIEPPQGDNLRKYPSTLPAESRAFLGVNRGKRGMVLDLKQEDGYQALLKLVRRADVLAHNFRPAVAPRLRIDYETLRAINPRLIYCAVSGYGESGQLRNKAGYDQVLQSLSGICALQGTPEDPKIVYGSIVDYYAASLLAGGIASALFARERTGEGRFVGISLLRSALALQSARLIRAEGEPPNVNRDMRSGGITGLHPTRSGSLYISANTPHFWSALCELVGLPEIASDSRYDTVRKRAEHADEIVPRIRNALKQRTALEWEALFGERVPCAAVRQVEDMFDHPQVLAEQMMETYVHPTAGSYRGLARPIKFGSGNTRTPSPAPMFGQHSAEILAECGYTDEEISRLRDIGVIVQP